MIRIFKMDRMEGDLLEHFQQRVVRAIEDDLDTSQRMELRTYDAGVRRMAVLVSVAAVMAIEFRMSKKDFTVSCGKTYDRMMKR